MVVPTSVNFHKNITVFERNIPVDYYLFTSNAHDKLRLGICCYGSRWCYNVKMNFK